MGDGPGGWEVGRRKSGRISKKMEHCVEGGMASNGCYAKEVRLGLRLD